MIAEPPSHDALRLAETPADREEPVIVLPRTPDEIASPGFPWIMMVAPAVMGVGLVLMTGSTYGLLFAAFGPLLALATVIEQSVQRRRRLRAGEERFAEELAACERQVVERLRRERRRRFQQRPPVRDLLISRPDAPADRDGGLGETTTVALGTTAVPSGIRLDAPAGTTDRRVEALARLARSLDGVPHVESVSSCVITGPSDLVVQAALGILMDLAARPAATIDLSVHGDALRRILTAEILRSGLEGAGVIAVANATGPRRPRHEGHAGVDREPAAVEATGSPFSLTLVDDGAVVAAGAGAVLEVRRADDAIVVCGPRAIRVRPQLITTGEFQAWASRYLDVRRTLDRVDPMVDAVPTTSDLAQLLRHPPPERFRSGAGHLAAPIGAGADGPVWLDLVGDGPHVVIGGTTGSGKSELLRSWIAALATRYPATHVAVLCIDFKGGATFDAIADLPHCVGVVTDLDGDEAVRVLAGLRAELRRREHALRRLGARDIDSLEPGSLERLVVVVDEFQALMDEHRDLHDAFADLAARGRSLGIHVILCAQRPAGAARESLLANCTIRLSLRVTNEADSHTLIGSADAARLPARPRGRAIVATGDGTRHLQIARVDDELIRASRARRARELDGAGRSRPNPPWLPPLPVVLPMHRLVPPGADLRAEAIPVALVDDPDHQRQMPFALDARGGRHLVLLGPSGSGKTTALRAIHQLAARAGVQTVRIPTDAEGAWDELQRIAERRGDRPAVIILDDLDERAAAFGEEHRQAWLDLLRDLAKLGTARSQTFVASASRGGGEAGAFLALAARTVRLGSPSRTEFILSGGEAADHRPDLPPGRGVAGGLQLQFPSDAAPIRDPSPPGHEPLDLTDLADRAAALVTRRPHRWIEPLGRLGIRIAPVPKPGALSSSDDATSAGRGPSITMGDPDEWRQSFGALARHAARAPVVFDDLPVSLTRGLLPGEPTVPPVSDPGGTVLVRESTGGYRRRAWAGAER